VSREDGETIAYLRRWGKTPTVVWLGGFKSDMFGAKAQALAAWADPNDRAFLRFDYFGHGASSGDFRKGTISRWRADTLAAIDRLTDGDLVLVGSSMGGWLALLAGQARAARIKAMLLLAPAVDFTQTLLEKQLPDEARKCIEEKGEWLWPSGYDEEPYPITRALLEDGRKHLLFGTQMDLAVPIRILQGMKDPDVPWQHAVKLAEQLKGDVELTLIPQGEHRLSTPADLARMIRVLEELLD
jgi:pimeloyl-ACP methyl ester carboxylesterase